MIGEICLKGATNFVGLLEQVYIVYIVQLLWAPYMFCSKGLFHNYGSFTFSIHFSGVCLNPFSLMELVTSLTRVKSELNWSIKAVSAVMCLRSEV